MNTLQRQQPILGLFRDELASGTLHALSVRARTPAEQSAGTGLVQIQGI
jgi:acid stress-induced BolA-like protein IbaG/YrbA